MLNNRRGKIEGTDSLDCHTTGAGGELAVCIWSGLEWTGENERGRFKSPDINPDIFVRTRDNRFSHNRRNLFIWPDDPITGRHVLVLREAEHLFSLQGWINGTEAKQERNWKHLRGTKTPAYWVEELNDMESLDF